MTILEAFGNTAPRLHHFYLVEGAAHATTAELAALLTSTPSDNSLHIERFFYSTLGVEEAELLRTQHVERAPDGHDQCFLIFALSVTHEAQQSLLKMFEEPRAGTHFFLLMPETTAILPTVRSRAQYVRLDGEVRPYVDEVQKFITLSKEKRLAYVSELIKSHEDDETSGKLRLAASQFISALIEETRKDSKNLVAEGAFLRDAVTMRGYLDSRGASVKMILEHLALTL
jgi:DNA polymerase III delta prime subunit